MKTFFWTKQLSLFCQSLSCVSEKTFRLCSLSCALSRVKKLLFFDCSLCFSRSPQKAKSVFCVLTRRLFDSALFRVLFLKWKNVCSFSKWRRHFFERSTSFCQSLDFSTLLFRLSCSGEKTLPLFFFDFCSRVCDKIKLLSPLKKKPKKSKRTLLFFTFSFYSFEVTLFRIVFAFPLLLLVWTLSLLFFFDSCNE